MPPKSLAWVLGLEDEFDSGKNSLLCVCDDTRHTLPLFQQCFCSRPAEGRGPAENGPFDTVGR